MRTSSSPSKGGYYRCFLRFCWLPVCLLCLDSPKKTMCSFLYPPTYSLGNSDFEPKVMKVWFNWFSFSNRWFSSSMLIYRGSIFSPLLNWLPPTTRDPWKFTAQLLKSKFKGCSSSHRGSGGTLGMVRYRWKWTPHAPYIVDIYWVCPLFKGSLGLNS